MPRASRARAAAEAAAVAAAKAVRTPTPLPEDPSEEENGDTPMADTSQGDEEAEPVADEEEEEDPESPAPDSEAEPRLVGRSSVARRGRRGRPPKVRAKRDTNDDLDARDTGSEAATPRRRGGWRGRGFGGGRWAKNKGGTSHITQVALDKEGTMANVIDDEVELPEDADGETKVDKNGLLQGGREYRVRTFPIEGKGERLYMLSTEPARCIGFRDSYLFFQKHPHLFKIILSEDAKRDLIERNLIPHSYKGRAIGVVTARSVFREFGAKIVIGGKKIIDDYQVAAAKANGEVEGEYAVPDDEVPADNEEYDRNRFVAWHGASAVYHTGGPSVPMTNTKAMEAKKRRAVVTGTNWMLEHAREASRFNSVLAAQRRQNMNGVYDIHTNTMHFPKIMQPTHARWEQIPPASTSEAKDMSNGHHDENAVNGTDQQMSESDAPEASIFTPVPEILSRNFLITDTYYESPPSSTFGYPGPAGSVQDVGPGGLSEIPEHVWSELPDDCREEFLKTREDEREWRARWGTETEDKARAEIRVTYNV